MPVIIHCPTCRNPLTVHEMQAGLVVACPTCRHPLTVPIFGLPVQPEPPSEEDPFEAATTERRRSRRAKYERSSSTGLAILFLVVGGAALLAGGYFLLAPHRNAMVPTAPTPASNEPAKGKTPAVAQPKQLSDEMVAKVKRATVYIRVEFENGKIGSGSGFFAAGSGQVLTNAHVVGPSAKTIEVVIESGTSRSRTVSATVRGEDPVRDLALLEVNTASLPVGLEIGDESGLRETHEVYIFGFPLGERLGTEITVNKSSVSSLRLSGPNPEIQLNGGVNPGNSGGPVVDVSGKVVGVVVATIRGTQIDFAIPAGTLKDFLRRMRR